MSQDSSRYRQRRRQRANDFSAPRIPATGCETARSGLASGLPTIAQVAHPFADVLRRRCAFYSGNADSGNYETRILVSCASGPYARGAAILRGSRGIDSAGYTGWRCWWESEARPFLPPVTVGIKVVAAEEGTRIG